MILQTVERALRVLLFLADQADPVPVKVIAEHFDLNLTTTYHLVNTLKAQGFAQTDDGAVTLGPAAAHVGAAYHRNRPIDQEIERIVEEVASASGETTYLGRWDGEHLVVRVVRESVASVRVGGLAVGYRGDEHHRASGLAVLAHLHPAALTSFLSRVEPALDEQEASELLQECEDIRACGYAVERGRFTPDGACIAVPFFESDGTVVGALTISAPITRFDDEVDSLLKTAQDGARKVSQCIAAAGGAHKAAATSD